MKIMFDVTSKNGNDKFVRFAETEKEFDEIIEKETEHYRTISKLDLSINVVATVVDNGECVYCNQLV